MRHRRNRRRTGRQHGRGPPRAARLQSDRAGERAPPALSHRRVAPADEPAHIRTARCARQGACARYLQSGRGLRGGQRARLQHLSVCTRARQEPATLLSSVAAGLRPNAVRACPRVRRADPRGSRSGQHRAAGCARHPARGPGRGRQQLSPEDALPDRCQRPRHLHRQKKRAQAQEQSAPECRHLRSLPRRRGTPRRGCGQHQHLRLRARLDVDDPAPRWRDERGSGMPPRLSQAAPRPHARVPARHTQVQRRIVAPSARRRADRQRGAGHRQLLLRRGAHGRARLGAGRGCFRVPRPGVLFRSLPGDEPARSRRRRWWMRRYATRASRCACCANWRRGSAPA